jgi:hypothetical protein
VLFVHPGKRDAMALVHTVEGENGGIPVREAPAEDWRRREGFALTDPGPTSPTPSTRATIASPATTRERTPVPWG